MLFPSKVTSFNESVLKDALIVAKCLQGQKLSVLSLYNEMKQDNFDGNRYFAALDVLFALGKIKLETVTEELSYVD